MSAFVFVYISRCFNCVRVDKREQKPLKLSLGMAIGESEKVEEKRRIRNNNNQLCPLHGFRTSDALSRSMRSLSCFWFAYF